MRRMFDWHRPLMVVAGAMAVCVAVCLVGMLVDDREVLGVGLWLKPFKFSVSIMIYAVTWAWLIAHLPRYRRIADVAGTVAAIALLVEQVVIVGAAAVGTTSHFNVSSALHTAMWGVMAVSITVLYVCTFITTIAAFFLRLSTPSITLAFRIGAVLGLVGLGLAYLMTSPTSQQLENFQGIAGAHAVGLSDGGPGLPLVGWSTVGGDLRIPHFVGMHALQVMPLFAIALGRLGRSWRPLGDDRIRSRLVVVAGATYALVVALVTFQALAGQSIAHPAGVFVVAGWGIAVGGVLAAIVAVVAPVRRARVLEEAVR